MVAKKCRSKRRGSRAAHCALMRQHKRATSPSPTPAPITPTPPAPITPTPPVPITPTPPTSASKRKLDLLDEQFPDSTQSYVFFNIDMLKSFMENFVCPSCHAPIVVSTKESSRRGFSNFVMGQCSQCSLSRSTYTSQTLADRTYDINRRTVSSFLSCGLGFAGINTFCEVMGMSGITERTHTAHVLAIHQMAKEYDVCIKDDAASRIRQHHGKPSGILNLAVSFDGSWHKRGFSSRHGIGAVIEVETGLVIDYQVMATFCQVCATTGKKKLAEGDAAHDAWFADHKAVCTINREGSAGLMEVAVAKILWGRSQEMELQYTTMVSDGDSKTFAELTNLDPYNGVEIVKEECTNHVAKRLGTNLRRLVTTQSQAGNTLGGRKVGALTQQKIGLLQSYYKKAVSSRCSSVEELRKRILRTIHHVSSTDDKPRHEDCPTGISSWCFFQRALAFGKAPPSHVGKSTCFLSPRVASSVLPVYTRLTTDALLSRCLAGLTQNSNESFHAQVWMRCPKHLFVGRRRLEVALTVEAANFNSGSVGFRRFLSKIECSLNGECIKRGQRRDVKRVLQAQHRGTKEAKRRRQMITVSTARAQDEYHRREGGPSYASGAF